MNLEFQLSAEVFLVRILVPAKCVSLRLVIWKFSLFWEGRVFQPYYHSHAFNTGAFYAYHFVYVCKMYR